MKSLKVPPNIDKKVGWASLINQYVKLILLFDIVL